MVMKEKDEELALFLDMGRREKEKNNNLILLSTSDGANATLDRGSPVSKIVPSMLPRKTAADKFLDSENDKSDYDWLLTPPGTPLFPSLEMESKKTIMIQMGISNARPTALKSRLTNIQEEPASRNNVASKRIGTAMPSGLNSSSTGNRRPSSAGRTRTASRPATPTGRPSLSATAKPSRPTLPPTKPAAPAVRSSTPTRAAARSPTPAARPTAPFSKSMSRSATPTRLPSTTSSAPNAAAPLGRSSSATKTRPPPMKNPVSSRGSSPTIKSRTWKPNEVPGFSLDAPPNLRTLPERPASASRGRPGVASTRSSSLDSGSKGKLRQQSCSPARGRAPVGNAKGSRISIPAKSVAKTNSSDDVNPVLMGTKMVERVVNMRKLAPPKQDDHQSSINSSAGKSSLDGTGFGRTLSKKSLDMALRHMDIRRTISGNLRPLMTNIPASSMYSVRSGGSTRSKTVSVSDSPLATSSNTSSEPSVNYNNFDDGIEVEDTDFGSERGNSSSTNHHSR